MAHLWLWAALTILVLGGLAVDLGVHRHQHRPLRLGAAIVWSLGWIALALGYGALVWWRRGGGAAAEFYTAWLLEKSLSFDNLMLFLLVFERLRVPEGERHRVLSWGILGALVLRGVLIVGGVHLLHRWHFVVYLFGAFLAYTGVHTLVTREDQSADPLQKRWVRALERVLPLTPRFSGSRFFVVENGRRVCTLLFFALVVVELADLMFAVDSIPAVFGVTEDLQIVFSSNVLAVLGLRALYLVIERLLARLRYLRIGIGVILILVGVKMCVGRVLAVPAWLTLSVTLAVLGVTVLASLVRRPRAATAPAPPPPGGRAAPGARASSPARPAEGGARS